MRWQSLLRTYPCLIDRIVEHFVPFLWECAGKLLLTRCNTSRVLVTGLLERIVFSWLPAQPCDHRERLWESFGLRFQGWRMVERSQPSERFFFEKKSNRCVSIWLCRLLSKNFWRGAITRCKYIKSRFIVDSDSRVILRVYYHTIAPIFFSISPCGFLSKL